MTATRKNISIEQGATFTASFDIPDSIDGDLSRMVAFMEIRIAPGAAPAALLSTAAGNLVIHAETRKITAHIAADVTTLMRPRCYFYDVKLLEPDAEVYRIAQGFAVVDVEVTEDSEEPPADLPGAILLESGGYLLLENGGRLLLEDGLSVPGGILLESGGYLLLESGGRLLLEDGIFMPGAILLESGGYLLLETGGRLLTEEGTTVFGGLLLESGGYLLNETGGKIFLEA